MNTVFFQGRTRFKSKLSRTIAFLCATAALHYLFFESASRKNWETNQQIIDPVPLSVRLQTLNDTPREASVIRSQSQNTSQQRSTPKSTVSQASGNIKEVKVLDTNEIAQKISTEPIVDLGLDNLPQLNTDTSFTLRLPPSAEFDMEVSYTKANGSPTRGIATLVWSSTASSYSMSLVVSIDMVLTTINLLQLTSEGMIGKSGLMPTLNNDTRRSRPTTAIHFNHTEKTIVFSSSNKTVKLEDGGQDALSVLVQLAAIGNSDPSQLSVGKEVAIQVAEGRDASIFTFHVVGEEEFPSSALRNGGKLRVVHLIRPPRPGSYNSTLEIWLSPEHSWYPVQIRNTESSGTVTNQRVTAIRQIERMEQ